MTLQPPQPSRHRTTDSKEHPETPEYICTWVDVGLKYEQPKVDENGTPYANQCLKIGNSNAPWSQLPWLGGRGPRGPQGPEGDGLRIVGVLSACGPPTSEESPDPEQGDMWVVSCANRDDTTPGSCMAECDGLAYVWDGESWQSIGSIQGPPGNNIQYFYEDFTAAESQTEFVLSQPVQLEASFVTINGVVISPVAENYTLDFETLTLTSDVPVKAGDIVGIFSFIGAVNAVVSTLTTADIATVGARPVDVEVPEVDEIRNQQDVNWYLLDVIQNLDGTISENLEDYATQEWVLDQSYITEQVVADAISNQAADQALVDQDQDREIEALETRVSQIESVSLDARYLFEGDAQVPRDGEFTILKAGGSEIAEQWSEAAILYFAENAVDGSPDWGGVTENDVIRIGGSSAGIIVPTDIQSREADTFAEFRVDSIAGERLFNVSLVRSASQPLAGVEYGVVLLSSFDPSGLATTDFVVSELAKKFDKSGGTIKGAVAVEDGNLTVKNQEFRVKTATDENAFRVQPNSIVTFNIPTRMNAELDMKDNKIIGCGPADPDRGHDVVNVDFLNAAIGTIDTNVGDAELSANNTFTGINTFTKEIRSTNNTVFDFQGDANNPQDRHFKIRRGINMTIYCYSGNNNDNAKKCFHATWAREDASPEVFINYLKDPSQNGHPVNLRYANSTYLKISDYSPPEASVLPRLSPVVFKCDQFVKGTQAGIPLEGEVCGMHNSAPGSSTAGNPYWGNVNVELRVHVNKLRDESGGEIAKGYNKVFAGYVTLVGKDNKMYLKAAIHSVTRDNDKDYVRIHFDNRTKPFGTGSYNSSPDGYAVLIEGYDIHA